MHLALALALTDLTSSSTVSPFLEFHACTWEGSVPTWALEKRPEEDGGTQSAGGGNHNSAGPRKVKEGDPENWL